jgi:hypothetical protein
VQQALSGPGAPAYPVATGAKPHDVKRMAGPDGFVTAFSLKREPSPTTSESMVRSAPLALNVDVKDGNLAATTRAPRPCL